MKQTRRQQQLNKRRKKKRERKRLEETEKNYEQRRQAKYEELLESHTFTNRHGDLGKLLYSYSDARAWIDLPRGQKFGRIFRVRLLFPVAFAALLCAWFLVSLICRLQAGNNDGKTLLRLLPSFFAVAACTAVLLISAFAGWGKLLRWGFKRNLIRGQGAVGKRHTEKLQLELELADLNKDTENRIDITPSFLIWTVDGKEEIYKREQVMLLVSKCGDELRLVLKHYECEKEFPVLLPADEYAPLKKALRGRMSAVPNVPLADAGKLRKNLKEELPFLFGAIGFIIAGIALTLLHYTRVPEIPPFSGAFFIGMAPLFVYDLFSRFPSVKAVGIPLNISLVMITVFPWALVWWIRLRLSSENGSLVQILFTCDPLAVAFTFFTGIGIYILIYSLVKLIDVIRFGTSQ